MRSVPVVTFKDQFATGRRRIRVFAMPRHRMASRRSIWWRPSNEPSCSNASCHAHRASTKVLGVVDVALRLDPVQRQTRAITLQTVAWTALEVAIGAAFVILFTRRFVATPIQQLIEGTKAVSA